ncbi:MAG: TraM recognition domain-containing protein, partial [Actinomycetes bacterium]
VAGYWNDHMRIAGQPLATVGIYSPDPSTIPPELREHSVTFSPLTTAGVYSTARRSAKSLVEAALTVGGGGASSDNSKFFNASAISALADLLFLCSVGGQNRCMREVYELVAQGSQTMAWSHIDELALALFDRSADAAESLELTPAEGSLARAACKRFAGLTVLTKSGAGAQAAGVVSTLLRTTEIYGTSDAGLVPARAANSINFSDFLNSYSTLYVCPPAADGEDYIQDLACLAEQLLQCLDAICASAPDARLPVRCNISLDELANLSLVSGARLKRIVSTVRSMNASLLLAAQDLSQLHDRYGQLVINSVVSNCRSRCFLPGVACPITVQFMEAHFGRRRVQVASRQFNPGSESRTSTSGGGSTVSNTSATSSHSVSFQEVPLMPQNRASELHTTEMFASTGSSKLHLLQVRYFADPDLLALSEGRLNPYGLCPDVGARTVAEDSPDPDSVGSQEYEI